MPTYILTPEQAENLYAEAKHRLEAAVARPDTAVARPDAAGAGHGAAGQADLQRFTALTNEHRRNPRKISATLEQLHLPTLDSTIMLMDSASTITGFQIEVAETTWTQIEDILVKQQVSKQAVLLLNQNFAATRYVMEAKKTQPYAFSLTASQINPTSTHNSRLDSSSLESQVAAFMAQLNADRQPAAQPIAVATYDTQSKGRSAPTAARTTAMVAPMPAPSIVPIVPVVPATTALVLMPAGAPVPATVGAPTSDIISDIISAPVPTTIDAPVSVSDFDQLFQICGFVTELNQIQQLHPRETESIRTALRIFTTGWPASSEEAFTRLQQIARNALAPDVAFQTPLIFAFYSMLDTAACIRQVYDWINFYQTNGLDAVMPKLPQSTPPTAVVPVASRAAGIPVAAAGPASASTPAPASASAPTTTFASGPASAFTPPPAPIPALRPTPAPIAKAADVTTMNTVDRLLHINNFLTTLWIEKPILFPKGMTKLLQYINKNICETDEPVILAGMQEVVRRERPKLPAPHENVYAQLANRFFTTTEEATNVATIYNWVVQFETFMKKPAATTADAQDTRPATSRPAVAAVPVAAAAARSPIPAVAAPTPAAARMPIPIPAFAAVSAPTMFFSTTFSTTAPSAIARENDEHMKQHTKYLNSWLGQLYSRFGSFTPQMDNLTRYIENRLRSGLSITLENLQALAIFDSEAGPTPQDYETPESVFTRCKTAELFFTAIHESSNLADLSAWIDAFSDQYMYRLGKFVIRDEAIPAPTL